MDLDQKTKGRQKETENATPDKESNSGEIIPKSDPTEQQNPGFPPLSKQQDETMNDEDRYDSKSLTVSSVPPLVLVEAIEYSKSKKNGRLLYKKRRHCFYCGFYCEQIYRVDGHLIDYFLLTEIWLFSPLPPM